MANEEEEEEEELVAVTGRDEAAADGAALAPMSLCCLSSSFNCIQVILFRTAVDDTTHLIDMSDSNERPSAPLHGQINWPVVTESLAEDEEFPADFDVNSTANAMLQYKM